MNKAARNAGPSGTDEAGESGHTNFVRRQTGRPETRSTGWLPQRGSLEAAAGPKQQLWFELGLDSIDATVLPKFARGHGIC